MPSSSIPDLLTGDDGGFDTSTPPSNSSSRSGTPAWQQRPTQQWGTTSTSSNLANSTHSSSHFLAFPIARVGSAASSLYRRITDPETPHAAQSTTPPTSVPASLSSSAVFQPPRSASPFAPPPLAGLTLGGWRGGTSPSDAVLGRVLAEEIRLLVPPRLQLAADWRVVFSVAQDGVSLSTLYSRCAEAAGGAGSRRRGGWVLAVRDGAGGVFGAFLSDAPHPSASYYGTGECFLWRASVIPAAQIPSLGMLPPPPSADTSHLSGRNTTLVSSPPRSPDKPSHKTHASISSAADADPAPAGVHTPDQIRFKAFPYSGVNDYLIYCEHDYLSIGGGDGRYGLWLDSSLERGVSAPCMTFGNEALSDEGQKFEVIGVEVWFIAA